MSDVRIGVTLPQFTDDPGRFYDGARRAEEGGLDSVWVFDHLWPLSGGHDRPVIECWSALAWLAARTERIGIGTLVTRSSLRNPALLAKMAHTVSLIAPGRLVVGLGSGDDLSREENEAFDLPYWDEPARLEQFGAVMQALRPFSFPVWAAGRSREALEIAGRLADGWNGWGGNPSEFEKDAAVVRGAAEGRPVETTWAGLVVLADDDEKARAKLGARRPQDYVVGGPQTVASHLNTLVEAGATHLICSFSDAGSPGAFELLAGPVRAAMGLT